MYCKYFRDVYYYFRDFDLENKMIKMKICALFFILLCSGSLWGQESNMEYTITPIPKIDRTDLLITLSTKSKKSLKINPLKDQFGTKDIHQYVTNMTALNGAELKTNDTIAPNTNNEIYLKYTLSYNPSDLIRIIKLSN